MSSDAYTLHLTLKSESDADVVDSVPLQSNLKCWKMSSQIK